MRERASSGADLPALPGGSSRGSSRALEALRVSRATAALRAGDFVRAEAELLQAIAEDPQSLRLHLELGLLYFEWSEGRSDEHDAAAEAAFGRAAALDPDGHRPLLLRGRVRFRRGLLAHAKQDFRAALHLSPGCRAAEEGLELISAALWKRWSLRFGVGGIAALLLAMAGAVAPGGTSTLDEADTAAAPVEAVAPSAPEAPAPEVSPPAPAAAHHEPRRPRPARVEPTSFEGWMARAEEALRRRDTPAAFEAADRARRIDPARPAIFHLRARAYLLQGRRDLAADALETYLALAPDAEDAAELRATLFAR